MELTPEQEARMNAVAAELAEEIARVGVDMPAANLELEEVNPPTVRHISDTEHVEMHAINVFGMLDTLRSLPDNGGTAAFVAAYSARLSDSTDTPHDDAV